MRDAVESIHCGAPSSSRKQPIGVSSSVITPASPGIVNSVRYFSYRKTGCNPSRCRMRSKARASPTRTSVSCLDLCLPAQPVPSRSARSGRRPPEGAGALLCRESRPLSCHTPCWLRRAFRSQGRRQRRAITLRPSAALAMRSLISVSTAPALTSALRVGPNGYGIGGTARRARARCAPHPMRALRALPVARGSRPARRVSQWKECAGHSRRKTCLNPDSPPNGIMMARARSSAG